ncbi:uncharacterized protein LOC9645043 isoform X1 [Selaginella moellendorffii]|uniref:uncharacterized protein LOC9645043 isoform X1 n=1 Tax=Selaginella moellendorffii TaxID=88036 RepID=UPI000D1CE576|nr:uncharacterized protein LOC9645043 isoform X1 [Selaginella moellendorffii]|eukprot:XP_024545132.1 uncharacterized protein LOC9645043 isoform X1 [Selaginella moellendorffii]
MGLVLRLAVPHSFSLARVVCSYGFYMMQPNRWLPESGDLERPLRLKDGRAVVTILSEEAPGMLAVRVLGVEELPEDDREEILSQVKRMLRLSDEEDFLVTGFHALHPKAKEEGFGRLIRSPTLFEDMVKSILLCNCGWGRTLQMARALCELQFELKGAPVGYTKVLAYEKIEFAVTTVSSSSKKRKSVVARSTTKSRVKRLQKAFNESMQGAGLAPPEMLEAETGTQAFDTQVGAFPTPEELKDLEPDFLSKRCGLGYRSKMLVKLAQDVASGDLELGKFEGPEALQGDSLRCAVLKVYGFGPFCCANVMMLLGNYNVIPADSETLRHLKQFHGMQGVTKQNLAKVVAAVYEKYKPYEFLAYWWEIWRSYEQRFGDLTRMSASEFHQITGVNMKTLNAETS